MADILWKLRVAVTVLGLGWGVGQRSSEASRSSERLRVRFEEGCACDCSVPARLRVRRPLDAEGTSGTSAAGVDGSTLTLLLLPGRSSEIGRAPAAVLTDWLRVGRVESSAVDETTECGLRSRLGRPRARVDRAADSGSGSADGSESSLPRFLIDFRDLAEGSVRFSCGLTGSTYALGDGRGDPRCRFDDLCLKVAFNFFRGGVARAEMMLLTSGSADLAGF